MLANERGVALLLVLWIFIFLFVVAFEFSGGVREDGLVARRYAEESRGYYLALAGFQDALYQLLNGFAPPANAPRLISSANQPQSQDIVDGSWREKNFGQGLYRVRLSDEAGKINLNRVDEPTLRLIFTNLGIDTRHVDILTDSILDWRDEDDLHRTNGAENDYYLSLAPAYTAQNGAFDSVESLLWVRGVTSEIFFGSEENGRRQVGLQEIFTVDNPTDRINLRTAAAEVIHAMTGLTLEKSQKFVDERKKLSERTLPDILRLLGVASGEAATRQFVFVSPTVITIEAAGRDSETSAIERRVKGVVRVVQGGQGTQIVRWIDRDFSGYNRSGTNPTN